MAVSVEKLNKKFYPDLDDNWDDEILRKLILQYLSSDMKILDLGAGAGIVNQMNFKGLCRKVVGIDPDSSVLENPYLDEGFIGNGEKMPFANESFDLLISDNVWEHIERPQAFLAEANRVLKPNGLYLSKTPNKHHYMAVTARSTPHWFHEFYNSLRGRAHEDTFPTRYQLNSKSQIIEQAMATGFEVESFATYEGRPEYLKIFPVLYLLGIGYERLVNNFQFLEKFRVICVTVLRKL